MTKCGTCGHPIHPGCNFNQGRCPHQPPMVDTNKVVEWFKNVFQRTNKD